MTTFGAWAFFGVLAFLLIAMAIYAGYRMTQRAAPSVEDTGEYQTVMPSASPVLVEVAQEWAIEQAEEAPEDDAAKM